MNTPLSHPLPRRRPPLRQGGFTLVELITVILILGVLAAVALPRFADLQGKARESKVKAVAGSMRAAAGLVKASAMAGAISCGSSTGSVTMEGTAIALNYCYPQALSAYTGGILAAANVDSNDNWTASGGGATAGTALTLQLSDAATPSSCSVVYTSPALASAQPVVTVTVGGC